MRQHYTFTLGVNYWPRKKAMYWWKDFERAEAKAGFVEIAALMLEVLCVSATTHILQSSPSSIP
jgi:hypothetical protein